MKITQLTIDNIRSHFHTEIPLDRLSIIRGENGAGKSAVRMALEFLFTGRVTKITDEGGAGQLDLLRQGEKKGTVAAEITIEGHEDLLLRASLAEGGGRIVGLVNPADRSWNGAQLLAKINQDLKYLRCLLSTRYFVDLDPQKQKSLLAKLILPEHHQFDAEITQVVDAAGIPVNWALSPFAVIEGIYKQAFEQRTLVNRDLKQLNIAPLPENPSPNANAEAIRIRLKTFQRERTDHALTRERAVNAHDAAVAQQARLKEEAATIALRLKLEEQALDQSAKQQLSEDAVKKLQKAVGNAKKGKELDATVASLTAQQELNEKALAQLEVLGEEPACPTCKQAIGAEQIKTIGTPLILAKDSLVRTLKEAVEQRKALGDYEGAQAKLDAHKLRAAEQATILAKVNSLRGDLISADKKVEKFEVPPAPDTATWDEVIATLDKKIDQGNEILGKAGHYAALVQQQEAAIASRDGLTTQLARLERLVAYFGPGDTGIKAKLIAEHIGGFESSINQTLHQWGYATALSLEPYGFHVQRWRDGENYGSLQLHQLSDSQLYRFAVAFQVALAIHSGYKLVVIDAADVLDEPSEKALYRTLFTSELDQAIVLSTAMEHPSNAAPGAIFLKVGDDQGQSWVHVVRHNVAVAVEA